MSNTQDFQTEHLDVAQINKKYGLNPRVKQKPELRDENVLLSVRHLMQYFTVGKGRKKVDLKAVDDISFDVHEGECVGIVGESGCGKTTTGRSIIKLYEITSGSVYYRGVRISAGERWTKKAIKDARANDPEKLPTLRQKLQQIRFDNAHVSRKLVNEIQMIFQDPIDSLDPRMTVEDIIQEGLRIQGHKDKAKNHEKVVEMLEKVGLVAEHASRYPHEFSGGQRQRIGIARALIMNPRLLICDEPISALDVSIRAQIINLLNELKQELGLSIIFIAHDLSVVKYFCDRIVVMYFGKVVEMASSDELFKNPSHPYTKALLSAIPKPNPLSEKNRDRLLYDPSVHDYSVDQPTLRELKPGHMVYCNEAELAEYKKNLKD
jgi:oligopeptide transport system ATP-binding protein